MRKFLIFSLIFLSFLRLSTVIRASDLEYKGFKSEIVINQDRSITVKESIVVDFLILKHGIFRNIPQKGLRVLSVNDENGHSYKYKVSGGSTKEIKIGDPDKTITGKHTYVITYQVRDAIKEFPDHLELYWNITGSDWDSDIPKPSADVNSQFADITQVKCFAGEVGTSIEKCLSTFEAKKAHFTSNLSTGVGSDFTIVVGLDKNNSFLIPTTIQKIVNWLRDYWWNLLIPLPLVVPFYYWFKRGRDLRYVSDNIYYKPEDQKTKTASIFDRNYLPLVYSPIKGLTPGEVGVILDEKVDNSDLVAEITELARLGYLKIKEIHKKWLFGKSDYEFAQILEADQKPGLMDYQEVLLSRLFASGKVVKMSDLRQKFYKTVKLFKDKLYSDMVDKGYFVGNPETTRSFWMGGTVALGILAIFIFNLAGAIDDNILPVIGVAAFGLIGILFAKNMPRRTALGHSLFRQIEGLKWYVGKGQWKHQIAEKRLFVDEMLPLAISLGVVGKLASDMKELGLKPPRYYSGTTSAGFASSISGFESGASHSLASTPGGKGGSGFGGGSGGGGGGGGGGGW